MTYEELTPSHLREWGRDVETLNDDDLVGEHRQRLGYALRDETGALIAIGGVRWMARHEREYGPEVDLLGWVELRDGRSKWVHRMTVEVIAALAAAGERALWAVPDPTIPRAQAWLERLGFVACENGAWRRDLVAFSVQGRVDGGERRRHAVPGRGASGSP